MFANSSGTRASRWLAVHRGMHGPTPVERGALRRRPSILLSLLLLASPAEAHLSMIRQGLDSAASLDPGDRHGSALAAGDFNGDGFDDLAVGAPHEAVRVGGIDRTDAGAVVVSYACASTGALSGFGLCKEDAQVFTSTDLGVNSQDDAQFGFALASGYFNADSYADLAIGAPYEAVGMDVRAGRVYVLYGGPSGLSAAGNVKLNQSHAGGSVEPEDEFGRALAAGNFNGDTSPALDDLVVGAPGEDGDAGAVFYFPAAPGGITTVGARWFKQSTLGNTNEAGSRFGSSLAAGNLYGPADGSAVYDDLAAGAPWRTVSGLPGAGVVYLILGGATGLTSSEWRKYSAADAYQGAAQYTFFGAALAAGRFSDNDHESLAIGEPERDMPGGTSAGRVVLAEGTAAGLDFDGFTIDVLSQGAGTVIESNDYFGWSLAAGNFDGDEDDYDDLAVGSPGERNDEDESDAGLVQVFLGSVFGLNNLGASSFTQRDLNDDETAGDQLGYAVVFGRFDDSGNANLAVGAPGQDDDEDSRAETPLEGDAGCVFIVAPWRQVEGLLNRNTVVLDCQGRPVFSQRPHDKVYTASTAKVMTVLLACERAQADPTILDVPYDVPHWVGWEIGGSSANLYEGERWKLDGLMQACMAVSGNDAAYAIADLVAYGGEADDFMVCAFVDDMNARATLIGMTPRTHFSNPAGFDDPRDDCDDHYSTAHDMALLGREAMQNTMFRDIAGTSEFEIDVDWSLLLPGLIVDRTYEFSFIAGLKSRIVGATGIKPGGTGGAGRTRLVSADQLSGRVVVSMYAIPYDPPPSTDDLYTSYAALLDLGFARCNPATTVVLNPPPAKPPIVRLDDVPTAQNVGRSGSAAFEDGAPASFIAEVHRQAGTGQARLRLEVTHVSEAVLDPGAIVHLGIEPFESHQGFRISNTGPAQALLQVVKSQPPAPTTYVVPAGASVLVQPYAGPRVTSFYIDVRNIGTSSVMIEMEALACGYQVVLGAPSGGAQFSSLFSLGAPARPLGVSVFSFGRDTSAGSTVRLIVRSPDTVVTGVPDPGSDGLPALEVLPPWPNPFSDITRLAFALRREGRVEAAIYDVRGRRVWHADGDALAPGRGSFEWNGARENGDRLGSGVYFYEIRLDGRRTTGGKVVLRR